MRTQKTRLYLLITVLLLIAGCENDNLVDPGDDDEPQATFSDIQANIFNLSCAVSGCHLGASAPQGLDLSAGNAYANLVNVASGQVPDLFRVDPGNADGSYLVIKLEGGSRMAAGTARMPRGRDPLSSGQIATVREWIEDGALDN